MIVETCIACMPFPIERKSLRLSQGAWAEGAIGAAPRLMNCVTDLPLCTPEEWTSLRDEVAYELWCQEQEGQAFTLVSARITTDGRIERHNLISSLVNPIPFPFRPIVGHQTLTFDMKQSWPIHGDCTRQQPMTNRTTVLQPHGLVGALVVTGSQWAEPLAPRGVRVHSSVKVEVNLKPLWVGKTIAHLVLRRAESRMKALPEDTQLYLAHRKSAEGRRNVLEMGSWSGAAVKSAGPGGSEETRDESQESDAGGAADEGGSAMISMMWSSHDDDDGGLAMEASGEAMAAAAMGMKFPAVVLAALGHEQRAEECLAAAAAAAADAADAADADAASAAKPTCKKKSLVSKASATIGSLLSPRGERKPKLEPPATVAAATVDGAPNSSIPASTSAGHQTINPTSRLTPASAAPPSSTRAPPGDSPAAPPGAPACTPFNDDGSLYAEAVGEYVVAIRWPSLAKVGAVEDEGLRRDYARAVEFLRQRRTPYGLLHDLRAVRSIEKLSPIAQGLLDDALELRRTGLMLRVAVLHSVGGVVGHAYIPLLLKLSPIHPAIAFRPEQAEEALRWVADEDRPRMATSMHGTEDGKAHDGFAGIQSAWQKRVAEPVQEFGQSLAKAIENAPVAFERHVAEPVQEFSQNLAKGVSEHVTEPVHEFGQNFAKGMDEHVAKPVRNFSGEVGEGLEKFVRELAPKPVPEADLERLVRRASAVLVSSAPGTAEELTVAKFSASATNPEKVTLSFHGPVTLASAGLVSTEDAKIGAIVQVFWAEGIWYDATIVDVVRREDGSVDVKLHYKGFGKRFDDWQPLHEGSVRWPVTGYDLSRDGKPTSQIAPLHGHARPPP